MLREKSDSDLLEVARDESRAIYQERKLIALGRSRNSASIKTRRKNIARIQTILTEREGRKHISIFLTEQSNSATKDLKMEGPEHPLPTSLFTEDSSMDGMKHLVRVDGALEVYPSGKDIEWHSARLYGRKARVSIVIPGYENSAIENPGKIILSPLTKLRIPNTPNVAYLTFREPVTGSLLHVREFSLGGQ